jgi:hypothetical protein
LNKVVSNVDVLHFAVLSFVVCEADCSLICSLLPEDGMDPSIGAVALLAVEDIWIEE